MSVVRMTLTIELFWCVCFPLMNYGSHLVLTVDDITLYEVRRMVFLSWSLSFTTGSLCWLLKWKLYSILFLYNLFAVLLFTFLTLKLKGGHQGDAKEMIEDGGEEEEDEKEEEEEEDTALKKTR